MQYSLSMPSVSISRLFPLGNPKHHQRLPGSLSVADIFPVFLPFAGCPHRCVFCDQNVQTGSVNRKVSGGDAKIRFPDRYGQELVAPFETQNHEYSHFNKLLEQCLAFLIERHAVGGSVPVELAFYGGTFTAVPDRIFMESLDFVQNCLKKGLISGARCSTRPDALAPERLRLLCSAGFSLVELGIQSFHDAALAASCRGYDGTTARQGCQTILDAGLSLGIQLLPGMPGSSPDSFGEDVQQALLYSPSCLRLYPCLVVQGTPLADFWAQGLYSPWSLETTISTLGKALASAWSREVPVIRMSLAPEPTLEASILAGPRHPALGSMIQAEALFQTVAALIQEKGRPPSEVLLPSFCRGFWAGHRGAMRPAWERMGISTKTLRWVSQTHGELRWDS